MVALGLTPAWAPAQEFGTGDLLGFGAVGYPGYTEYVMYHQTRPLKDQQEPPSCTPATTLRGRCCIKDLDCSCAIERADEVEKSLLDAIPVLPNEAQPADVPKPESYPVPPTAGAGDDPQENKAVPRSSQDLRRLLADPTHPYGSDTLTCEELAGMVELYLVRGQFDRAFLCCAVLNQDHPNSKQQAWAIAQAGNILRIVRAGLEPSLVGRDGRPWEAFFRYLACHEPGRVFLGGDEDACRLLESAHVLHAADSLHEWLFLPRPDESQSNSLHEAICRTTWAPVRLGDGLELVGSGIDGQRLQAQVELVVPAPPSPVFNYWIGFGFSR
jgi:hypothetical protein